LKLGISRAKAQRPRRKITLSFRPKGEIFLRSLAFARDDMPCSSLGILGVLAREQGASQWLPATTRKVGERCSQSCCVGFLICLFIAVGVSSLATAQENDRAALIERAKKEGEVVWYTSAGLQDSNPMAEAFQKDYPFIRISVIRAGSGVLINRILNEARAQKGLFDVLNTNDESVLPLKKRGLIARYVSTEAAFYDDDLKDKEGYWHAAYVIPWFLGYNTKMVKKDELPKTYEELLNPKWKGRKIALGSDNGSLILSGLMRVWGKEKAMRYFQQLA